MGVVETTWANRPAAVDKMLQRMEFVSVAVKRKPSFHLPQQNATPLLMEVCEYKMRRVLHSNGRVFWTVFGRLKGDSEWATVESVADESPAS